MDHTEHVCWTRMQAEAGQSLPDIVARKEAERAEGGGTFSWGVGNAPARALAALVGDREPVDLLFSTMLGRPRPADVSPASVLLWRAYVDAQGREVPLPAHMVVTSRGGPDKRSHYALFARSDVPLALGDLGAFDPTAFRNAGRAGGPVAASQVTALMVRHRADAPGQARYRVAMRARLHGGYWVRLAAPLTYAPPEWRRFEEALARPSGRADAAATARRG